MVGTSDPYVKITYNNKTVKTKHINNGTEQCNWNEVFSFTFDKFESLKLEVYDKDNWSADDFMGIATLDMSTMTVGMEVFDAWHQIKTKSGKKVAGEIHLRMQVTNPSKPKGGAAPVQGMVLQNQTSAVPVGTMGHGILQQAVGIQPGFAQPMMGQPMMGQPTMGQLMGQPPIMGQPPMMGQPQMGQPHPGYGAPPPAYGAPPPQGYGQPQQGFPPPQGGYGAPPSGYPQPPPQGYGAPPPPQGYGAPPPRGYGAPPPQGQYQQPPPAQHAPAAAPQPMFDPNTGAPLAPPAASYPKFDPNTGAPLEPPQFDPATGAPMNKAAEMIVAGRGQ